MRVALSVDVSFFDTATGRRRDGAGISSVGHGRPRSGRWARTTSSGARRDARPRWLSSTPLGWLRSSAGCRSGHQLEPPYLQLVAFHARLERPETVKALGRRSGFVHDKNGAVPHAHTKPLLSAVALGTRLGEHAQVKAEGAVLDLDATVRRGDENPFLQRRRIVGTRARTGTWRTQSPRQGRCCRRCSSA